MKGFRTKKSVFIMALFLPFLGVLAGLISGWRLYFNFTYSLPHTVYIGKPSGSFVGKKGDYIVFHHPAYPHKSLIKQIKGLPGDPLILQKGQLRMGQETFFLLTHNRKGEELQPLPLKSVPVGTVFVAGSHSRSFDSRYEKFGLIHQSQIRGQVWPLF